MGRFFKSDRDIANARMDQILEAIENRDSDALKGVFSELVRSGEDDMDENIICLFDFIQGDVVSYDDGAGPYVSEEMNADGRGYVKKI